MTSPYLPLCTEISSRQKNCRFDSNHKWSSLLLTFVIATIGLSVQNTNLHLEVERSGLGAKLNVIKSQI